MMCFLLGVLAGILLAHLAFLAVIGQIVGSLQNAAITEALRAELAAASGASRGGGHLRTYRVRDYQTSRRAVGTMTGAGARRPAGPAAAPHA